MKKYSTYTQIGLALVTAFIMIACDGNSHSNAQQQKEIGAIDTVVAYAENGKVTPTQADYKDAGVIGVDSEEKLAEVNQVVANSDTTEVDSTSELQAVVNDLGIKAKKSSKDTNTTKDANTTKGTTTTTSTCGTSTCGASTCGTSTCNAGKTCGTSTCGTSTCGTSTCNSGK